MNLKRRHGWTLAGLLAMASSATGQSLNIDLDWNAPPEGGGGPPSASFGAAANQPGFWNSISVIGSSPFLYDLSGTRIGVTIATASGGAWSGGAWRDTRNTGDYALLLNDGAFLNPWRNWTITGLANGEYRVVTYAVKPTPEGVPPTNAPATILVNEQSPYRVTGPMPGNALILGVTHSEHWVTVSSGQLVIRGVKDQFSDSAILNGFQLTLVPEPATISILLPGAWLLLRRRHS